MKRLLLISCIAGLALAQNPARHVGQLNFGKGNILIDAERIENEGATVHRSGHVAIETDALSIQADDVDFNRYTHQLVARGEVHVNLK